MLVKTQGIVLGYIKYKETSIIARIFTKELGYQSYIINGVRSNKGKYKIALFQCLTLLDLVVYHKDNKDLHRISEVKCNTPFHSIPFTFNKTSIALILAELISKSIPVHPDEDLFDFLHYSIATFDELESNQENFLLIFLYKLSRFLGFYPSSFENMLLQIQEKEKVSTLIHNEPFLFEKITDIEYQTKIDANFLERRNLLNLFLAYYRVHIENLGELKTLPILKEILH